LRRRAARRGAPHAGGASEAAELRAVEEAEADPARRHYLLARRTARAERDAAVEAANRAGMRAIDRIERLHREIEWALEHEEMERVKGPVGLRRVE